MRAMGVDKAFSALGCPPFIGVSIILSRGIFLGVPSNLERGEKREERGRGHIWWLYKKEMPTPKKGLAFGCWLLIDHCGL